MATRKYKIADLPRGQRGQEIVEIAGSDRTGILWLPPGIPSGTKVDFVTALNRAYQGGREDKGSEVAADAPETRTSVHWAVAYGCPSGDPNECAGILEYDDEADAREHLQWVTDGVLAKCTVTTGRWEKADA